MCSDSDFNVTNTTTWTGAAAGSTIGGSGTLNANGGLNLTGSTQLNWTLDRNAVIGGTSTWNPSGNDLKNMTGTGTMTVPIAMSPGREGFTPQLQLSYDHYLSVQHKNLKLLQNHHHCNIQLVHQKH